MLVHRFRCCLISTIHWPNVGSMLGHRQLRWPNNEQTFCHCIMFAGTSYKVIARIKYFPWNAVILGRWLSVLSWERRGTWWFLPDISPYLCFLYWIFLFLESRSSSLWDPCVRGTPSFPDNHTGSHAGPGKHEASTQCRFNAGPASQTVVRHWTNTGSCYWSVVLAG